MNRFWLVTLVLFLSSCSGGCAEIAAFKSGIAEHGADASDEALETALWTICKATPVGAVKRKFKSDEERAAYNAICPGEMLP
jgi:hypothetical protein